MRRVLACFVLALLCAGCAQKVDPADLAELESVRQQNAALNAGIDQLGVRLLEGQHRVSADSELKDRHQHVSQIACANLADHWAGINRFLDNQRDKEQRKRRMRVASAERAAHHDD